MGLIEYQSPPFQWEGSLADRSVAVILNLCCTQKLDGVLTLRCDRVDKSIFFLRGVVVHVQSDLRSETLGAYLKRIGKLSQVDYRLVVEKMRQTGGRQGEILLEMGLIGPHKLFELLSSHMTEKIVSCFAWTEGEYVLAPGSQWKNDLITLQIDVRHVILEGIKRHLPIERLNPVSTLPPEAWPYMRDDPPVPLRALNLSTLETRLVDLVRQGHTIADINHKAGGGQPANLILTRFLYALYLMEIIGFEPEGQPRPSVAKTPRQKNLSQTVKVAKDKPDTGICQDAEALMEDYLRLKEADFFALFGIDRSATTRDVHRAFPPLLAKYEMDKLTALPLQARQKGEELLLKAIKGYAVLADPEERAQYAKELTRRCETDPPKPDMESDDLYQGALADIERDHFKRAVAKLRKALEVKPNEPLYEAWLGWALLLADPETHRKKAERQFELARRGQPDMAEPYLFMARLCELDGARGRAEELYRRALEQYPHNKEIAKEVRLFRLRTSKGSSKNAKEEESGAGFNQDLGTILGRFFGKSKNPT